MDKKLILSILGLVVVVGLGFLVLKSNNKVIYNGDTNNVPAPGAPVENSADNIKEFGRQVTLHLNDEAIFTDGLKVILTQIDDSRCPEGVQCIWAGEVSVALEVSGGQVSYPGEIRLGTSRTSTTNVENYVFTLQSATKTEVTVLIQKN